ncbi:hypothetical protein [Dinoroseobacter sp. S124A]|uniref:hypothetical protein n=1 Tax=Dinoroseobacter sp. S124A TaxID=3415128 RepID=UPI003C7A85D3
MGWHIADHEGVLTLSRQPGARMDFAVEQRLPKVRSRRRLAHQIRQDVWRALRALRGFSPVVRVHPDPAGIRVEAGGQVAARPFPKARCEAILHDLLSDPQHQARWMRHA